MNYSIAIDGPCGAGKTTVAKVLAKKLGFLYVDTGALYRTLALYMLQVGGDPEHLEECLLTLNMKAVRDENGEQHMMLAGEDVSQKIRTPEISKLASDISAYPAVRDFLLETQLQMARENDVVMEGRDIGTVILPNATIKFFLTATPEIRAQRRLLQLEMPQEAFAGVLADVEKRDYNDSHRAVAPLRQAQDAILVDSDDMDVEQVVSTMEKAFRNI